MIEFRQRHISLLFAVLMLSAGCVAPSQDPTDSDEDATAHDGDGETSTPQPDGPHFLNRLETAADMATLATADTPVVKYFLNPPELTPTAPLLAPCTFQNMREHRWHIDFLRSFPELADLTFDLYVERVLSSARIWYGGFLQSWPAVPHPSTGERGIVSFVVYANTEPELALDAQDIIAAHSLLSDCAPFAREILVLVPADPTQLALFEAEADALTAAGVVWIHPSELIEGIPSQSYSAGEGYGTLRIIPEGQILGSDDYGPRDIVIATAAPNDISLVSGLVTADPQNLHSHVNLRLQEKGIPNAAIPDIYRNDLVRELDGLLVHLTVTDSEARIDPATLADAEAFWEANRPTLPELQANLTVTALTPFSQLSAHDADAFGAKAANLAELQKILPADNRRDGFAIPFAAYQQFIQAHGLDLFIADLLSDPRMATDAAWKRSRLEIVRDAIRSAPLLPDFERRLREQILTTFGDAIITRRLRFRSSTNVEDLDALTGAGLYDSRSGCYADPADRAGPSSCLSTEEAAFLEGRLETLRAQLAANPADATWIAPIIEDIESDLIQRKPLADAVRKVWASLWNERAFDERAFYGIDHRDAFMGIAVAPAFVLESLNAVAITQLPAGDGGLPLYRIVSQVGYESVVRPANPTATAEVLTFRRTPEDTASDIQHLLPSSLDETPDDPLWTDAQIQELAQLLSLTHDHFAAEVYPQLPELRLDIEIKLTAEGHIVLKQARPYLTVGP